MNTQGSLQLLANALNQDVEVLATSITAFYGLKGAYDPKSQQVVLDVNNVNRSSVIETAGHELSHAQGIQSETAADLMGKATGWAYDASVSSNQNIINQYKNMSGDGQDFTKATTISNYYCEVIKMGVTIFFNKDETKEKLEDQWVAEYVNSNYWDAFGDLLDAVFLPNYSSLHEIIKSEEGEYLKFYSFVELNKEDFNLAVQLIRNYISNQKNLMRWQQMA